MDRQNKDLDLWPALQERLNERRSVQARHTVIRHNDVGQCLGEDLESFGSVRRLADDAQRPALFQNLCQRLAHHGVIVGKDDTDHPLVEHGGRSSPTSGTFPRGMVTLISVPPLASLLRTNEPSSSSSRSRLPSRPKRLLSRAADSTPTPLSRTVRTARSSSRCKETSTSAGW